MVAYDHAEYRTDILPPPDELERYEALSPGITKAILDTYVAQVEHRIKLETSVIEGDNKRANKGQVISASLSFFCIALGGALVYLDKDIAGLSLIIGSIGTLLTAFYGGAILRKVERDKKSR